MCFSPEASFTSAGVLLVVGASTLSRVSSPGQIVLAATPLIFSIQQLSEGILWLNIDQPNTHIVQMVATYIFVILGQIFWPTWVPLSVVLLEHNPKRRMFLYFFIVIGFIISSILTYQTIYYPIRPQLIEHHIHYVFNYSNAELDTFSVTYLIPSVFSNFFSSHKKIRFLGLLTLIAFVVTKLFFSYFVFSIWCFFAAVISIYILQVILSFNGPSYQLGLVEEFISV